MKNKLFLILLLLLPLPVNAAVTHHYFKYDGEFYRFRCGTQTKELYEFGMGVFATRNLVDDWTITETVNFVQGEQAYYHIEKACNLKD